MKFFIFQVILFFLFLKNLLLPQISISGKITDAYLNPISNAFVECISASDTNLVFSDYTDINGNYTIFSNFVGVKNNSFQVPNNHFILRNYPNPFNP